MRHSQTFSGKCWRMKFLSEADDVLGPARAPEGRSHYDGQPTLYLSTSAEGTIVATRRYMTPQDPPRAIFKLQVEKAQIVDLQDAVATTELGIDVSQRAVEWQSIRARGLPSPTWAISDRVRDLGLDGMIYASRTNPKMTHLTLFRWNTPGAPVVKNIGPPIPFNSDI